ncbi:MAG: hypothetical protein FWC42_07350 [Proteobacteria bacterium]|nr:hypothetical protein [Pseudomonadota bacterium]
MTNEDSYFFDGDAVAPSAYLLRIPQLLKFFADEVQDAGDALIVRKPSNQERIPLYQYRQYRNPLSLGPTQEKVLSDYSAYVQ